MINSPPPTLHTRPHVPGGDALRVGWQRGGRSIHVGGADSMGGLRGRGRQRMGVRMGEVLWRAWVVARVAGGDGGGVVSLAVRGLAEGVRGGAGAGAVAGGVAAVWHLGEGGAVVK